MVSVADVDLQISWRGGHLDRAIRGEGAGSKKYFFSPPRASVWSKNEGEARAPRTPPLDPPLSL